MNVLQLKMGELQKPIPWYYRPWMVILMLFLVLGPFGLPLLYKSPKFNKPAKIILSLIMIPYTWLVVVWTIDATREAMRRIAELQGAMQ